MSFQAALCFRVIKEKDISYPLEFGITMDDFMTHEAKVLWGILLQAYSNPVRRGQIPSEEELRQHTHGKFILGDDYPNTTIEGLCEEVRRQRIVSMGHKHALEFTDFLGNGSGSPIGALTKMQSELTSLIALGTTVNTDVSFLQGVGRLISRMEDAKTGIDHSRMAFPWAPLQDATFGLQGDDYVLFYGRPKCIPLDEPVLQADGSFSTIQSLTRPLSLDQESLTLRPGEVAEHLPVVERQVVKLLTKSGYFVRVGDTHPILRPDFTYTAAGLLKTGDYVGVVRSLPFFKPRPGSLSPDECELLGLLVGDGGLTKGVTFTNIDEDVLARLSALVAPFRCHLNQYGDSISYSIIGDVPHENPLLQWLRAEETFGKKGRDKTVPPKVFLSGTVGAVAFLGGLLATDGTVDKHTVSWATSSEVMAGEVKHLLLRLGVVGSIVERSSYTGLNWSIDVTAQEQHEQLLALLPYVACERKRDKITRLTKRSLRRKRHNDGIPWSRQLEDEINQARPKASNGSPGGGWPGMWIRRTGAISRHLLRTLAEKLSAPSLLKWANSEVRWERLTVIEPEGIKPCSDVTITRHHNFVVGDFITHNSGKTWVLASLIASAYAQEKRLAIYTKEMTPDGIYMRALACILALDYAELRGAVFGRNKPMNKNDEDRIRELHNFLTIDSCGANAITVLNGREAGPGMDTVPWLRSKIERYKPDVVFVDGLYLLSDHLKHTSDQQRVMNISRGLRETILATNTPIIATTQANRKAAGHKEANLDEIGFSDSLGQDVTLAARVINDKTSPTMSLVIGGSREFALHGIRLNNIPAKDFSFHSILTEEDIQKATENDQGEEEKKEKKAKKPKKGDKTTNADREAKEKEAEEHHINNLQNGVV